MRSLGFLAVIWLLACSNEGTTPPTGRLNFPSAIAVTSDSLFVANSNFTLKYNTGSLQAYDLDVLHTNLEAHCGGRPAAERDLCGIIPEEDPGADGASQRADVLQVAGLLRSEVHIGSYAAGIAIGATEAGQRLYIPVRSDANLTFVDVDGSGCLACGGDGSSCDLSRPHVCAPAFREGDDASAMERDIQLPSDPVGIAVGPASDLGDGVAGNYVLTAHRGGRVSLFLDEANTGSVPALVHSVEGFPTELVSMAVDPQTRSAWMPNALEAVVSRVGVALDQNATPLEQGYLFDAGDLVLSGVDTGGGRGDTRAIALDPRDGVRRAYVLSRRPRALMTVEMDDTSGFLAIEDIMEVGFGPSRLLVQHFPASGRTLAFVSCFDSRDAYVLDVDQGRLVGIVRGLGGAFELAIHASDTRNYIYVIDFTASVIRVLDLAPMFECLDDETFGGDVSRECSPQPLGFVGRPRSRQELI